MTNRSRTASSLLVAITLMGTAPAAMAGPDQQQYGPPERPNQEKQVIGVPSGVPAEIVRVSTRGAGFDWSDAGIGAIGGVAVSMIGVGGVMAFSQRRGHPGVSHLRS